MSLHGVKVKHKDSLNYFRKCEHTDLTVDAKLLNFLFMGNCGETTVEEIPGPLVMPLERVRDYHHGPRLQVGLNGPSDVCPRQGPNAQWLAGPSEPRNPMHA